MNKNIPLTLFALWVCLGVTGCDEGGEDDVIAEGDHARVEWESVPLSMAANRQYTFDLNFRNVGSTTWSRDNGYVLKLTEGDLFWDVSEVNFRQSEEIRSGETKRFSITLTTLAEPGRYPLRWQLFQNDRGLFGDESQINQEGTTHTVLIENRQEPPENTADYTLVVLPDTQVYALKYPEIFISQLAWIEANRVALNIKFVLHEGDVTHLNTASEWDVADSGFQLIDNKVPYAIAPGNHDTDGCCPFTYDQLNLFFPLSRFLANASDFFGGSYQERKSENTYHFFTTEATDYLVIALEYAPNDQALAWADRIVKQYPSHSVIVLTHNYMHNTNNRSQAKDPLFGAFTQVADNDGEEIFTKLVKPNANVAFVLSGHIPGVGKRVDHRSDGTFVVQLLANYQNWPQGGGGYLRLLEFYTEQNRVRVKTYSPYLDRYLTDSQNQFDIDMNTGAFFRIE